MKRKALLHVVLLTVIVTILAQLSFFATLPFKDRLSVNPRLYVSFLVTRIVLVEVLCLIGLWLFLKARGRSFAELGLWKRSTTAGWIFGIALGLFTAGWGLMNLKLFFKTPTMAVLDPAPWHVYSALVAGLGAAFCEEIMFRGFIMTELAEADFGRAFQVVFSGILFGVAHLGYFRSGLLRGLATVIPIAILGMIYSLVYLTARRSLMPSIVSHFINDAVVIPLVFMAQVLAVVH